MNARLLYYIDGALWAVNAVLWAGYAHSPALAVLTALCAAACAFLAWRSE